MNRIALGVVTVGLSVLGAVAVVTALLLPTSGAQTRETQPDEPSRTTAPTPTLAAPSPAPARAETPITDLVDADWLSRTATATGIPERALAAYAGASIAVSEEHPGCRLGWNTLAAIGFVETEHATMNGATLHEDGTVGPPIIGVPLDGNGTLVVPDTDGGLLDSDTEWDRAVGPMQFIPETWAAAGQDGNRDGEVDVNQIDDAVLAAGMHLCEIGGDLSAPDRWIAAISAYNPSVEYNNRVAEAADHYASVG